MQQAHHIILTRKLLHELHGYLIVICGNICRCIYRRKLVLSGSDLVMLGLRQNTELPELLVELLHERRDARLYRSVIVVVKLLALGRLCSEKRSAGVHYILALFIDAFIY